MPALLPRVESDPDPSDVAGPGVDNAHEESNRGPRVTNGGAGGRVDDPQVKQSHAQGCAARAPKVDPVPDLHRRGDQVQKQETAPEDNGGGGVLRALVARACAVGKDAAGHGENSEQNPKRYAQEQAVDQPGDQADPEAGIRRLRALVLGRRVLDGCLWGRVDRRRRGLGLVGATGWRRRRRWVLHS